MSDVALLLRAEAPFPRIGDFPVGFMRGDLFPRWQDRRRLPVLRQPAKEAGSAVNAMRPTSLFEADGRTEGAVEPVMKSVHRLVVLEKAERPALFIPALARRAGDNVNAPFQIDILDAPGITMSREKLVQPDPCLLIGNVPSDGHGEIQNILRQLSAPRRIVPLASQRLNGFCARNCPSIFALEFERSLAALVAEKRADARPAPSIAGELDHGGLRTARDGAAGVRRASNASSRRCRLTSGSP